MADTAEVVGAEVGGEELQEQTKTRVLRFLTKYIVVFNQTRKRRKDHLCVYVNVWLWVFFKYFLRMLIRQ